MEQAVILYLGVSLVGVFVALMGMGAVYRASRPTISQDVIIGWWEVGSRAISVSPRHLALEHQGKSPLVMIYGPDKRRLLKESLQITIESRDGKYTYQGSSDSKAPGGRVCVDKTSYDEIKKSIGELDLSETPLTLKMKYPSAANIPFLLRDHPDMGVRASAWIFLLTSLFALLQWLLAKQLGV